MLFPYVLFLLHYVLCCSVLILYFLVIWLFGNLVMFAVHGVLDSAFCFTMKNDIKYENKHQNRECGMECKTWGREQTWLLRLIFQVKRNAFEVKRMSLRFQCLHQIQSMGVTWTWHQIQTSGKHTKSLFFDRIVRPKWKGKGRSSGNFTNRIISLAKGIKEKGVKPTAQAFNEWIDGSIPEIVLKKQAVQVSGSRFPSTVALDHSAKNWCVLRAFDLIPLTGLLLCYFCCSSNLFWSIESWSEMRGSAEREKERNRTSLSLMNMNMNMWRSMEWMLREMLSLQLFCDKNRMKMMTEKEVSSEWSTRLPLTSMLIQLLRWFFIHRRKKLVCHSRA